MRRFVLRAPLVVTLLLASAAAGAQTVDEIIAKNLAAKGGLEKWKAVSSVKMTGRITMQALPGAQELPLTVYARRPNYTRQEFMIQDKRIVQGFDGNIGWMINPLAGTEVPQELPPALSESMKNTSDFDGPLVDYKAKGNTIELVGKEKVGTKDVFHLKVTIKGQVQHYFLDAMTGMEIKKSIEIDQGAGEKQTLETEMTDYQQVDGIMVPKTIKQLMNGNPVVQMVIDKVEFNAVSDDAFFKMPKK